MCTACGEEHPVGTVTCPRTGAPVTGGPCGTTIDRYAVERWLGGGGAGSVYRARHTMIGQPVALKLLRPGLERDVEAVARFRREAKAAAAIGHPRIPRVIDLGVTADGRPFMVMDLLEGRDLRSVFEAEAPLEPARAVELVVQILEGLDAAHRAGIVHRDIKPANVFVSRSPEGRERVSLLDFGLSRMTEPTHTGALTAAGTVLGTPYYMAPEQATGVATVDARADLYATAVILYQALSRALPFPGDSVESVLVRIATAAPIPLADVAPATPPELVAIVDRGLQRDPAARWPTADAFARALRGLTLRASTLPATRGMTGVAGAVPAAPAPAAGPAALAPPPSPFPLAPSAPVGHAPSPAVAPLARPPAVWPAAPASAPSPAPAALAPAPFAAPAAPAPLAAPRGSTGRVLGLVALLFLLPLGLVAVFGAVVAVVRTVRTPPPVASVPSVSTVPVEATPPPGTTPPAVALSGPENPPATVQATLAATPVPQAPAPSGPKRPVTIGMPVLEGPLPDGALRELLARARTGLEVCRPTGPEQRVRLRFTVSPDGALTRAPFAGNAADVVVSSCVASRLEAQRLPSAGAGAAFRVEVALATR